MAATDCLIFVLGSHNWQQESYFSTGSAMVHELQHKALNDMPGVHCYSLWPSNVLKTPEDRDDYRVIETDHEVPICEGVHPQSSLRFHSLSTDQFSKYMELLVTKCLDFINYIVQKHGKTLDFLMAHHVFNNPAVLAAVNQQRVWDGMKKIPVFAFSHGTGMMMYLNELDNHPEFPLRFYPWVRKAVCLFEDETEIQGVFTLTELQRSRFCNLFPNFPQTRVKLATLGYQQTIFRKLAVPENRNEWSLKWKQVLYEEIDESVLPLNIGNNKPLPDLHSFEHIVVFCSKLDKVKRLELLLTASKNWEADKKSILTLIAGSASKENIKTYVDMAYYDLRLKNTYFIGALMQSELTKLFNLADIVVLPSKMEAFPMVLVEALACGTPVVGIDTWACSSFTAENVGILIKENEDQNQMARDINDNVTKALSENWKKTKSEHCANLALKNFSNPRRVKQLLDCVKEVIGD